MKILPEYQKNYLSTTVFVQCPLHPQMNAFVWAFLAASDVRHHASKFGEKTVEYGY